ncbi:MAG TPA: hypothetical protein PLK67_17875, partial [Bryobacteraceae bacterium]|nr:hypothetical protein [Bryobacteraceae bacterium]
SYLGVVLAAISIAACSRNVQSEAAVRQGVIDYLSSRTDLNISQMQVDISSVSFRQNEADVVVSFRPRGGSADAGMQMRYTLGLEGNRWVVKGKGSGSHAQTSSPEQGTGGELPPGHPPMGSAPAPETTK